MNEENPLKKFAKFCKQTIFGDFFNKFIYRIHLLYIKRAQMSTLAIKNQLFVYRIFVTVIWNSNIVHMFVNKKKLRKFLNFQLNHHTNAFKILNEA